MQRKYFKTGEYLIDIFSIAIELSKFEPSIKDSTKDYGMKFRVDLNESSDAEILIEFLQIFKPSIKEISINLPNNISDKVLKEMFRSLTLLSEKVSFTFSNIYLTFFI